jgi:hypothetical protein
MWQLDEAHRTQRFEETERATCSHEIHEITSFHEGQM